MAEIIIPRRNHPRPRFAEFLPGSQFRLAIEGVIDDQSTLYSFGRATVWDDAAEKAVVSSQDSEVPIYAWKTGDTLYWYTEANIAYLNADASYMFQGFPFPYYDGDVVKKNTVRSFSLSGISAAHAVNMMSFLKSCYIVTNPIPKDWNMLNVTEISEMFRGCAKLGPAVEFAPRLSPTALTDDNAESLFMDCSSLTSVKISCDLSGLTSLRNWFRGCVSLASFDFTEADISAVTTMPSMLEGCKALTAVDMQEAGFGGVRPHGDSMFRTCTGLKRVKFQSYTATASLAFGASMFMNCTALTEVDFTRIAVSGGGSLKASDRMFSGCSALSVVYTADDWTGGTARDVFSTCPIVGGAGTAFDPEHTDGEYARIDNRPTRPGYFTYKART